MTRRSTTRDATSAPLPTGPAANPGHRPRRHRSPSAPAADPIDTGTVVERPDGYHWTDESGRHEFGPFETANEAFEDMAGEEVRQAEDIDALHRAQPEIDIETAADTGQDDSRIEDT